MGVERIVLIFQSACGHPDDIAVMLHDHRSVGGTDQLLVECWGVPDREKNLLRGVGGREISENLMVKIEEKREKTEVKCRY